MPGIFNYMPESTVIGFVHYRSLDEKRLHITGEYFYPQTLEGVGDFEITRVYDMEKDKVLTDLAMGSEELGDIALKAHRIASRGFFL